MASASGAAHGTHQGDHGVAGDIMAGMKARQVFPAQGRHGFPGAGGFRGIGVVAVNAAVNGLLAEGPGVLFVPAQAGQDIGPHPFEVGLREARLGDHQGQGFQGLVQGRLLGQAA